MKLILTGSFPLPPLSRIRVVRAQLAPAPRAVPARQAAERGPLARRRARRRQLVSRARLFGGHRCVIRPMAKDFGK